MMIKGLTLTEMPDFYQSCVTSWAFFKAKLKNHDKEYILNENLFGNNNISVRNTSICIQILADVILKQ